MPSKTTWKAYALATSNGGRQPSVVESGCQDMAGERCKKTLSNVANEDEDPGSYLRDALLSLSRNSSSDMLGRGAQAGRGEAWSFMQ